MKGRERSRAISILAHSRSNRPPRLLSHPPYIPPLVRGEYKGGKWLSAKNPLQYSLPDLYARFEGFDLLFLGIIFYAKKTNLGRCQSMTITDKAAEKAKAILADEGKANWGIRIYVAGESCCGPSFGLNLQEVQMPEDEIVEKNGIKIFIDKETSKSLDGRELDFYTGEEGEGFIFTGGVSSCGTGGSCGSGSSGSSGSSGCGSGSSGCSSCG